MLYTNINLSFINKYVITDLLYYITLIKSSNYNSYNGYLFEIN